MTTYDGFLCLPKAWAVDFNAYPSVNRTVLGAASPASAAGYPVR
jgi:hypothetical protein